MTPQPSTVTMADVASAAGVSRAAVSKVVRDAYGVSPAMRERVEEAIRKVGYLPRHRPGPYVSDVRRVGLLVPHLSPGGLDPALTGALQALEESAHVVMVIPGGSESTIAGVGSAMDIDGMISFGQVGELADLERIGRRWPLVAVGSQLNSAWFDSIDGYDALGAGLVVRHLHSLGHRRIVHAVPSSWPRSRAHQLRAIGYRRAMVRARLTPELLRIAVGHAGGREEALHLLARASEPLAFFAASDTIALGILQAAAELELTPGQVSVVGYDDSDLASHAAFSLTSVNQGGRASGARAVELLVERFRGRRRPRRHRQTPQLQARRSSARAQSRAAQQSA